jgi:2-methylisocitrate lyase-like PEP mutase family enzyme
VDDAVERGNAYLAAGADCVYPILCPPETIADLAGRIHGPVNVVATPGTPPPAELEQLGVARMTWGPMLASAAYAEAARIAGEALAAAGQP